MRIRRSSVLAGILFVSCALSSISSENEEHGVDEILQQMDVMLDWLIEQKDGFIDPRIEIRRSNPKDSNSRIGIFVKQEAIQADELLIKIPRNVKIQVDTIPKKDESDDDDSSDDDDDDDDEDFSNKQSKGYQNHICKLAWALRDEYDDDKESDYYPYIKYLQLQQPMKKVPAMYSTAGQHLMLQTQREISMRTLNGFEFANDIVMWPWRAYEEDCIQDVDDDEGNSLSPYFIALAVQHGLEHAFVPFYDLVMHHSSKTKVNVFTKPSIFSEEQDLGVYALRDLEAGEELFRSYRECQDCYTERRDYLGTPEMLRDYGFVETYPHTFHFVDDITVLVDDIGGGGNYAARCVNDNNKCPSKQFVEARIKDLKEVIGYMIQTSEPIMEKYEYETIKAYHKALLVALTTVLPQCVNDPAHGMPPIVDDSAKRDEL